MGPELLTVAPERLPTETLARVWDSGAVMSFRPPDALWLDASSESGTMHMHGPRGTLSLWHVGDGTGGTHWRVWMVPAGSHKRTGDLCPPMRDRAEAVRMFFRLVGEWLAEEESDPLPAPARAAPARG